MVHFTNLRLQARVAPPVPPPAHFAGSSPKTQGPEGGDGLSGLSTRWILTMNLAGCLCTSSQGGGTAEMAL